MHRIAQNLGEACHSIIIRKSDLMLMLKLKIVIKIHAKCSVISKVEEKSIKAIVSLRMPSTVLTY